jgi:protease I
MKKIAVLITDMFEDAEYTDPAKAFEEAGYELVKISTKKGTVKGKRGRDEAEIDKTIEEADPSDYDALFIPGGFSPDKLRADDRVVDFVRKFSESERPMLSICHGPQLLISADVLRGRKVAGWKSIRQDIINAGGIYTDEEVVIDKNLVSSRQPKDIAAFIRASLDILGKK